MLVLETVGQLQIKHKVNKDLNQSVERLDIRIDRHIYTDAHLATHIRAPPDGNN